MNSLGRSLFSEVFSASQPPESAPVLAQNTDIVQIQVLRAEDIPRTRLGRRRHHHYQVHVVHDFHLTTTALPTSDDDRVEWNQSFSIATNSKETKIKFQLFLVHRILKDKFIGEATLTLEELFTKPSWELVVLGSDGKVVTNQSGERPCRLVLATVGESVPPSWGIFKSMKHASSQSTERFERQYLNHAMIVTRGTRGDVQPFIALARGLAETYGWMVTIVTEMPFKKDVKKYSQVKRGCIRFRPSGGDTPRRVESRLARWAMKQKSDFMQLIMLASSEGEFFQSEPLLYYWALTMKPDLMIFGFTMASIADIVCTALGIPMMGFILQPTCIPSDAYSPIAPLSTSWINKQFTTHSALQQTKTLMENSTLPPFQNLSQIRKLRGVDDFTKKHAEMYQNTWHKLMAQKVPLIVPIHEAAFGGKPGDWGENISMTDFIFLRSGGVPEIPHEQMAFIDCAKLDGAKLLVMAFSSMPVSRYRMLKIAITIIQDCKTDVRVMCLTGRHDLHHEQTNAAQDAVVEQLKTENRLFEDVGSPFGRLFPMMDAAIVHGGLGTTAEALFAGLPVIVTGVLLMDQRFWGQQMDRLGVGPKPVHVQDFEKVCVSQVEQALADDSVWKKNVLELKQRLLSGKDPSDDGVARNAQVVHQQFRQMKINKIKAEMQSTAGRRNLQVFSSEGSSS